MEGGLYMSDGLDRASVYRNFAIDNRERNATSVRKNNPKSSQPTTKKLLMLVQLVPNWETYLTEKQHEAVKLYMGFRDFAQCDEKLGLSKGGTYSRIFGDKYQSARGGVGRLEAAYTKLKDSGHFGKGNGLDDKDYLMREEN